MAIIKTSGALEIKKKLMPVSFHIFELQSLHKLPNDLFKLLEHIH